MTYSSEVLADSPLFYWRLNESGTTLLAATSSTNYGSEPPGNAFDGSATTYWTTNGVSSGWLRAQLASAVVETQYKITRRDDLPNRNPKTWTFEGSNDGTTWTVLDTQTNITWPTAGEVKTFTFANSTAYSYYRLNISANNGDTYLSVAELALSKLVPTAADTSGNGRPGIYYSAPTLGVAGLLTGDSDKAASFASGSRIEVANGTWMPSGAFSVEAIIKPTGVTGTQEIVARQSSSGGDWMFRLDGNQLKLWFNAGGFSAITASTTIVAGTAYHVVATWDGTTRKIYVGGTEVATGTATAPATSALPIAVAANAGNYANEYFGGVIDEVAVYGSALSAARVSAHYSAATTAPGTAAAGTASLSLSASGGTGATSGGNASLSLSASGGTSAAAGGSASLTLSASGSLTPPSPADGAAALSLSASGGASGSPGGTASLNLIATGTAIAVLAASGSATLTLTASGSAVMSAGGTAVLTLTAGGVALALDATDTSTALDGLDRLRTADVIFPVAVAAPPASVSALHYDKAVPYPVPVMVGGRPT